MGVHRRGIIGSAWFYALDDKVLPVLWGILGWVDLHLGLRTLVWATDSMVQAIVQSSFRLFAVALSGFVATIVVAVNVVKTCLL